MFDEGDFEDSTLLGTNPSRALIPLAASWDAWGTCWTFPKLPIVLLEASLDNLMLIAALEGKELGLLPPSRKVAMPKSDSDNSYSWAAEKVGLEYCVWNPPGWMTILGTGSQHPTPVPFFPEVHEELISSWSAPFSARNRPGCVRPPMTPGGANRVSLGIAASSSDESTERPTQRWQWPGGLEELWTATVPALWVTTAGTAPQSTRRRGWASASAPVPHRSSLLPSSAVELVTGRTPSSLRFLPNLPANKGVRGPETGDPETEETALNEILSLGWGLGRESLVLFSFCSAPVPQFFRWKGHASQCDLMKG